MKHRVFLAAPAGADRVAFRARLLAEAAPALLAAAPGLAAASLDLVDAAPAVPPWQRPGEPAAAAGEPAYDAVFDLWGEEAALAAACRFLGDRALLSLRLDETVEKDALPRPPGCAPGVKFLSLMTFQPDLPVAVARRLWAHHASLALDVHVGMTRYVRDWVIAGDATFHGIAELHFPSVEAMMTRWFRDEAGRAAIAHDVGHFLLRATRLYATEHVLKAMR